MRKRIAPSSSYAFPSATSCSATRRQSSMRSSWNVTARRPSRCRASAATPGSGRPPPRPRGVVSVFSMRSRFSPPCWRAKSQLKRNVRTPPMWRKPVGLGAMRTRTDIAAPIVVAVPLALVSDIHGSDDALAAVVAELEQLGHRARDLPRRRGAGRRRSRARCSTASQRSAGPSCSGTPTPSCSRSRTTRPSRSRRATSTSASGRSRSSSPCTSSRSGRSSPTLDAELDDGLALRAFHGSPRSYDDVILPETPDGAGRASARRLGSRRARRRPHASCSGRGTSTARSMSIRASRARRHGAYAILTGGSVEFRRAAMAERVLTLQELNRATLARQLLLERKRHRRAPRDRARRGAAGAVAALRRTSASGRA